MIKVFEKGSLGLFFAISVFILAIAIMNCVKQLGIVSSIIIILLIIVAIAFLTRLRKTNLKINYFATWKILRILSATVMLLLIVNLQVSIENTWDWGALIRYSYAYCNGGKINKVYLARYPNNIPIMLVLTFLCEIYKSVAKNTYIVVFQYITEAVAFILTQLIITFIYRCAKIMLGEKKAFFVGVFTLLCVPLYLYSQFLYTDVPALFFISLEVFIIAKLNNVKEKKIKIILCVLLGITAGFAMLFKVTTIIVLIAFFVFLVIDRIKFTRLITVVFAIIIPFSIVFFNLNYVCSSLADIKIGITEDLKEKYEFPYTHWIMMGLGDGYYSQDDVDFTASFSTREKRKEANILEIKERINQRGVKDTIKHIIFEKMDYTYGNSCMNSDHYVNRNPIQKTQIGRFFMKSGDLHRICLLFSWTYYIFLFLGVLFSAIKLLYSKSQKNNYNIVVSAFSILGFSLFSMIWECNSRYLFSFFPCIIINSYSGLEFFINKKKRNNYENKS